MTLIGVHELHERMHPNQGHELICLQLTLDPSYFLATSPLAPPILQPVIKTLVARQWRAKSLDTWIIKIQNHSHMEM